MVQIDKCRWCAHTISETVFVVKQHSTKESRGHFCSRGCADKWTAVGGAWPDENYSIERIPAFDKRNNRRGAVLKTRSKQCSP